MEKNREKELNDKAIFVGLVIFITAVMIGISYAFFHIPVEKEEEKIVLKSGDLALMFKDNDETVENIEGTWNIGDTIEKELVIENTGTRDAYAKISWDNLTNTYLAESLTYTLEEKSDDTGVQWKQIETANINVPRSESPSTQLLAEHLLIPAGHTYIYRLKITFENLENIDQTEDINAKFITKFTIDRGAKKWTVEDSLAILKIKKNPNNLTNFATPATTDETANGLFSMEDDYGTSYYYRGTAPNNYVRFGKNASGQDMWWRIIRFNGNGTMRMQYDGAGSSSNYTRNFIFTGLKWSNTNDAKYTGWMFGGVTGDRSTSKEEAQRNETDSLIKTKIDEWYKTNIVDTGYGNYVADSIFCNDRSTPGKSATGWSSDTGLGYGVNPTAYGSFSRFLNGVIIPKLNPIPSLHCLQQNDAFTVSDFDKGNGSLKYPIGLITADEIVTAGSGKYGTENKVYYLNKGNAYYTMSPMNFNDYPNIFASYADGSLGYLVGTVTGSMLPFQAGAIAPVINIKAETLNQFRGTGTIDNPYFLE